MGSIGHMEGESQTNSEGNICFNSNHEGQSLHRMKDKGDEGKFAAPIMDLLM